MDGDSDESEYLSSCNVCFTNFDLYQFRPKVLPCSHTFCFRCLQVGHFVLLKKSLVSVDGDLNIDLIYRRFTLKTH